MELKTLKDIIHPDDSYGEGSDHLKSLREEAIKWIKELRTSDRMCFKCGEKRDLSCCKCESVDNTLDTSYWISDEACEGQEIGKIIIWIEYFFNITEEDLK